VATTPKEALRRATEEQDTARVLDLVHSGVVSIDDAFEVAVELEAAPSLVRELIDAGADVNRRLGDYREPALHVAARRGDVALYRILRTVKASVSALDESGYSLVHSAACGGHVMLLSDALACGLDVNAASEAGETPLSLAMVQLPGDTTLQAEAKSRKVMEVLLVNGAKVDERALREARELGFTGIVSRLLGLAPTRPNAETPPTETPPAEAPVAAPKENKRTGPRRRKRPRKRRW
jgi:hypothetical protein